MIFLSFANFYDLNKMKYKKKTKKCIYILRGAMMIYKLERNFWNITFSNFVFFFFSFVHSHFFLHMEKSFYFSKDSGSRYPY